MRDKLYLILFILIVPVIVALTAGAALYYWPSFVSPRSVSDVIVLFEVIVVLIATINIGIFELNKKEIEAKTKEIENKVREISREEQIISNAMTYYTTARTLWLYYRRHKSSSSHLQKQLHQLEDKIKI